MRFRVTPRLLDDETDKVLHECSVDDDGENFGRSWVWKCSCGGKGRPQGQSGEASVFQWFKHAWRSEGMPWPKDSGPAYEWLRKEQGA